MLSGFADGEELISRLSWAHRRKAHCSISHSLKVKGKPLRGGCFCLWFRIYQQIYLLWLNRAPKIQFRASKIQLGVSQSEIRGHRKSAPIIQFRVSRFTQLRLVNKKPGAVVPMYFLEPLLCIFYLTNTLQTIIIVIDLSSVKIVPVFHKMSGISIRIVIPCS